MASYYGCISGYHDAFTCHQQYYLTRGGFRTDRWCDPCLAALPQEEESDGKDD